MTYLLLETDDGSSSLRLDQQETTGKGWQATGVTGLGMGPVALTVTPEQVGGSVRFIRKAERTIDIKLSLKADSLADREAREATLYNLLGAGKLKLHRVRGASDKHLKRVYYAGGGTYSEGDGNTSDTELEIVVTLKAYDPDWY